MAAAAFKVTMIGAVNQPRGEPKAFSLTVSDVANAYAIYPDGVTNNAILHGTKDVYIVDMILSAAGTDTTQLELFVSGQSTGFKLLNATSLATTVGRPLQMAPYRIPAGSQVTWKQIA
jgi:hypothetical protein